MNKHGAISTIVAVVILLAFLVVVLLYIIGPEAILPKLAEGAEKIADSTLSGLKKDKFEKPQLDTDKNVEETYENIVNVLRSGGNGPCILNHKPLVNDFKGFKIILSQAEQGIFVQLENNQKQTVKSNTISGKKPCVVGEGNAAQNFYDNYLKDKQCESNCLNDYSAVDIEFQTSNTIFVKGQKRDLKDGNILFKAKNGNICFFPTYFGWFTLPGCSAGENGLKDNCIDKIKEKIPLC